jgi:hypothetical protein
MLERSVPATTLDFVAARIESVTRSFGAQEAPAETTASPKKKVIGRHTRQRLDGEHAEAGREEWS